MQAFRNSKQPAIVSLKVGDLVLFYTDDRLEGSYLVIRKLEGFRLQNLTGESIYADAHTLEELLETVFRRATRDSTRIEHYPQSKFMLSIIDREDF